MEPWQKALAAGITRVEELSDRFPIDSKRLQPVIGQFPMRISLYYLNLIKKPGDPIWRQCIPDPAELKEDNLSADPLDEEGLTPVRGLIHRYPDRVVLLVSSACATLCRFCMRKHRSGSCGSIETCLDYIQSSPAIRDVLLSGGDPLLLPDDALSEILSRLRKISHLEIIRIDTRTPVTLPDRITLRLCRMLKQHHPLFINTHFNHPFEITPESARACTRLADAGIPLGNQTVLLKDVNDDLAVMKQLMQKLLTIRVRPYYIHQMDLVRGTGHFRTSIDRGLEIMAGLRGHTSGLATPYYMIDLPGGKGKVPILPEDIRRNGKTLLLRNYLGEVVKYEDV